jgi:hypothetical protein
MFRALNGTVLVASALLLATAFWNRNDLPATRDLHPALAHDPLQRPIAAEPRTVSYAGVDYRVEPLFDYELHGLVVSYRQHDGESSMHQWSNDHFNVADVCVVWSDSAASEHLPKLHFWNGIFTCNVETRDREAWAAFKMNELSNNHLITADPLLRDEIEKIRVGDQIRVKGQLARYGALGNRGLRGTSTTREDTGDGACETILVSEFEIVRRGANAWRTTMWVALGVLLAALAVHFAMPYRPYRD